MPWFAHRGGLVVVDQALLLERRVVVLATGRPATLTNLHHAHEGLTNMLARAVESVWWPGLSKNIAAIRAAFANCMEEAPNQPRDPPEGNFTFYGLAEELTSNWATVFNVHIFEEFCQMWGVKHQVSSAHQPHSNLWAEVADRTFKRALADCMWPGGRMETDSFTAAMLHYMNTPCRFLGVSPVQILFAESFRAGCVWPLCSSS